MVLSFVFWLSFISLGFPPPQLISARAKIRRGERAPGNRGSSFLKMDFSSHASSISRAHANRALEQRAYILLRVVGGGFFAGGVSAEHAVEDGVDIAKLALQIEGMLQCVRIEVLCDANVVGHALLEVRIRFPCGHGVFL